MKGHHRGCKKVQDRGESLQVLHDSRVRGEMIVPYFRNGVKWERFLGMAIIGKSLLICKNGFLMGASLFIDSSSFECSGDVRVS